MPRIPADPEYRIRRMIRAELDLIMDWGADEGWNPGLHDAEAYWQVDPQGLLVGELRGELIASLAAPAYDATFGFLSLYMVRPQFRGRGYGLALWEKAVAYLDGRNIGLDAVSSQQENYAQSGFRPVYRNVYCLGRGGGAPPAGVVALTEVDFGEVVAYDAAFFPSPRPRFLKTWLHQPGGAAWGICSHQNLAGYGVIRPCRRGYKIGPLFADSLEIAGDLLQKLLAQVPGRAVVIAVPAANLQAQDLIRGHRLRPIYETTRMYTKGEPGTPLDRLYAHDIF